MSIFENLGFGFSIALVPVNILYCFLGVTLGTFIGVLPGLGPLVTISVLLPLTFSLSPSAALIMLAGIYYGANYGGSTTAILVNVPGCPSSAVTCIEGYKMALAGRAGPALVITAIASFVGGSIATVLIAVLAQPLSTLGLMFRAPDYFSLMVLALIATASLVRDSMQKGIIMACMGVLVGLVGMDIFSGTARYTFGMNGLADGVHFVIIAVGVFGIAHIITVLDTLRSDEVLTQRVGRLMPSMQDLKLGWAPSLRGTGLGSVLGILPGTGPTIAAFVAYLAERRLKPNEKRFGNGAVEGIVAPEAANNAAAQTSFIPTLTLGIPGSATMALMLGALMIHGINPGPQMIVNEAALFWGLVASMFIGNLFLLLLNVPLVGIWVKVAQIPFRWLFPAIVVLGCVGAYSLKFSGNDLLLLAIFGAFGYVTGRMGCEMAPFILGFVLGPLMEENLRRSMLMSRGDPMIFLNNPISAAFLIASVALLIHMIVAAMRRSRRSSSQVVGDGFQTVREQ